MKTITEMKKEIKNKYDAIPEKQITTGQFLHKIGRKYIHILNIWGTPSIEKISIEHFYNAYLV